MTQWIGAGLPLWRAARARGRFPISGPFLVLLTIIMWLTALAVAVRDPGAIAWRQGLAVAILAPLGTVLAVGVLQAFGAWRAMLAPAQVALVPRMAARMRRTAALALGLALLPWLALAAAFPHWLAGSLAMIAYVCAFVLVRLARTPHALWWMGLLLVLMQVLPRLSDGDAPPARIAVPIALFCLCLAWRSFDRLFSLRPLAPPPARDGAALARWSADRQRRSFARALRRRQLLPLAFGTRLFTGVAWMNMLVICGGALALEAVSGAVGAAIGFLRFLMVAMLLGLLAARAHGITAAIRQGRTEQALYKLAPAAPRRSVFNRALARLLLKTSLGDWLLTTLAALGLAALYGLEARGLMMVAALMLCVLALAAWPLRDYARDTRMGAWPVVGLVCVQAILLGLSLLLWGRPAYWLVPAALALLAAAVIGTRYRAMSAAPVAFPAGRLHVGEAP